MTGYCYINGVENVDTDEYDISVVLHEYGHQILKSLKLSDSYCRRPRER